MGVDDMLEKTEIPKVCPECGGTRLQYNKEKGEVTCPDCGLVIEEKMIDFGKEWSEFGEDENKEKLRRTGPPMTPTIFDKGLGTTVGSIADLRKLPGKTRNKYMRMRGQQGRSSASVDRNLKIALAELKRVVSFLNLPRSVEEEAADIYTQSVYRGFSRGRPIEQVVTGAIYAACRNNEVPRTLDEFANASGITKKEIGKTYRLLMRGLGIKAKVTGPTDYMSRFVSALKLSPKVQSKAIEIVDKMSKANITSGRGPTSLAAAAIYISALMNKEKRTQREVADVCGVTEVTVRNRYREMLEIMNINKDIKKIYKR
jgi:transcription initiation factor TFIIB